MIRNTNPIWGMLLLIPILITGCTSDEKDTEKEKIFSGLVDARVSRFEEDLFSVSPYGLSDSIQFLEQKYPDFFPLFTYRILNIGGPEDEWFLENLIGFTTDFTNYRVSKRVKEVFPDLAEIEEGLSLGFSQYEGYLPGKKAPRFISCITGFNQSIITDSNLLAFSLDKYLGEEDEFYRLLDPPVPQYIRRIMRPEKIVPDALQAWLETEIPYRDSHTDLLSNMIYYGRIMYCVKKFLPGTADTLLWGFTREQMNFCEAKEREWWLQLIQRGRLFSNERLMIIQFIQPAPNTKEFGPESPGRAAVWLGYRIVDAYMRNHRDISVKQLMNVTDYAGISNASRYNP